MTIRDDSRRNVRRTDGSQVFVIEDEETPPIADAELWSALRRTFESKTCCYQRDTSGNFAIANARLAWEFLPLSFLYVVFTDTRSAFAAMGAATGEQKLVVKLTYTWRL